MTLHMLSSTNSDKIDAMRAVICPEDKLLLLADAIYKAPQLAKLATLYVREKDLRQRGLALKLIEVRTIDDKQWVELTLSQPKTIHWHD